MIKSILLNGLYNAYQIIIIERQAIMNNNANKFIEELIISNLNFITPSMPQKIDRILLYPSKPTHDCIYLKVQSQQTFISQTACFTQDHQLQCSPQIHLSHTHPLKLEVWNYQPHKLIKTWIFELPELANSMQIINQTNWNVFIKISPNYSNQYHQQLNKENNMTKNNSKRQDKKMRSKSKQKSVQPKFNQNTKKSVEIASILQRKSARDRQSIKKTLKSTIDYIIKQQIQINNYEEYGLQQSKIKSKTGKCTPVTQQHSHIKHQSTLFCQYGLNITELNSKYSSQQASILNNQSKKKNNKIR